MPTTEHVLYIPAVLLLGLVLGWVFGARATRQAIEDRQKRARE